MNRKLVAALWATASFARPFEIGGMGGYGEYRNANVTGPAGSATAGFDSRFAMGAVIGDDLYPHLSGELRYLFQDGAPFVSSGTASGTISGQSHALHYDLLFQVRRREYRLRPYGIAGAGVKYYRTSGPEPAVQPLPGIVALVNRNQLMALVTAGAGVRFRLRDRVYIRADFVDYLTRFPSKLLAPAPGETHSGIIHQLTPTLGISFRP